MTYWGFRLPFFCQSLPRLVRPEESSKDIV